MMNGAARLAAEIDSFEAIISELAAIAARTDPQRLSELIAVRRRLAQQIVNMRDVGARAFDDPAVASEFRSRVSAVFSVVSMHQANWPAVSIDDDEVAYRQSALAAADSNRKFVEWTRGALAQPG